MIKRVSVTELYEGKTADRSATNFPNPADGIMFWDLDTEQMYISIEGSWKLFGGGGTDPLTLSGTAATSSNLLTFDDELGNEVARFDRDATDQLKLIWNTGAEGEMILGNQLFRLGYISDDPNLLVNISGGVEVGVPTGGDPGGGSIAIQNNAEVEGTLTVDGTSTMNGALTINDAANADINLVDTGDSGSFLLRGSEGGTNMAFRFDGTPSVSTKGVLVTFFRTTNVTGDPELQIHQGDNTNTPNHIFRGNGGARIGSPIGGTPATVGVLSVENNIFVGETDLTDDGAVTPELGVSSGASSFTIVALHSQRTSGGIGGFAFMARNSAAEDVQYARVTGAITGSTNGSENGQLLLQTKRSGAIGTKVTIGDGVQVGSPTGGDKGAGTLNANAVYDDNVLLTDFVFDDPDYEMLTIPEMEGFFKTHKRLPTIDGRESWEKGGKPPLGKLVSQLWETIEVQARYIAELNRRLERLEGQVV